MLVHFFVTESHINIYITLYVFYNSIACVGQGLHPFFYFNREVLILNGFGYLTYSHLNSYYDSD